MANALYGLGKQKLLSSTSAISLDTDTIKACLVTTSYIPNLATDEFYTSISAYLAGGASATMNTQTMGTKTITLGVFDAADLTFPAVTAAVVAKYVVIWKDTGTAGTSPLLACIDTITGFPLTTNGGDVTVQWDNGAYKIFSL
jgi:hypothetical protein